MASKHGSRSSRQPVVAEICDWQGDRASPELDDLAHQHTEAQGIPRPGAICDWKGDTAEPELDDLASECIEAQKSTGLDDCGWRGDVAEPELDDLASVHAAKPLESSRPIPPVPQEPLLLPVVLSPKTEPPKEPKEESGPTGKPIAVQDRSPIGDLQGKLEQVTNTKQSRQSEHQDDETAAQVLPFKIPGFPNVKIPGLPNIPFKVPSIHPGVDSKFQSQALETIPPEAEVLNSTFIPSLPAQEQKPEGHKKTKEVKTKKKEEKARRKSKEKDEKARKKSKEKEVKAREKKAKDRAEKVRKAELKAERKAKDKEKRERKENEKRERRAKKYEKPNNSESLPPPLPLGAVGTVAVAEPQPATEDQQAKGNAIEEVKKKLQAGWEDLPSINSLASGVRKALPGNQDGKSSADKSQKDTELRIGHQSLEVLEQEKILEEAAKKVQDAEERNKKENSYKQGMDGAVDEPSECLSKSSKTLLSTVGIDHTVSSSLGNGIIRTQPAKSMSQTSSSLTQSVSNDTNSSSLECGHPRSNACPSRPGQTSNSHHGTKKTMEHINQQSAPGMLKRASCLCGAMPPKPSDFAEYDTPDFPSPSAATPSEKGGDTYGFRF